MAEVVYTITKENANSDWFKINANTLPLFSDSDVEILYQTKDIFANLAGYISSHEVHVDDKTLQRVITFDTFENANSAFTITTVIDEESPFYKRKHVIEKKLQELGQPVTLVSVVVNP